MRIKQFDRFCARAVQISLLLAVTMQINLHCALAAGSDSTVHPPIGTNIEIADLVMMFKWLFGGGGVLLAIFGVMCITFFGVNIRDARNNMDAKAAELSKFIEEARKTRDEARAGADSSQERQNQVLEKQRQLLRDSENVLSSLKSESQDIINKLQSDSTAQQAAVRDRWIELDNSLRQARILLEQLKQEREEAGEVGAALQEAQEPSAVPTSAQVSSNGETSNDGIKTRIREVIQASSFEWTTIGRIMKRTGLSHDVVTNICASMPDLEISRGKKTGDAIYKFKSSRT